MSPQWTKLDQEPTPARGRIYFDAELRPNRSLSPRAFFWAFGAFTALSGLGAIAFWLSGAYPVAGFMGLEILLFAAAFAWNYRDGRARERVLVAADRLHVAQHPASGAPDHWIVHPHWARVEAGERAVTIAAGARSLDVAHFLSPDERDDFAAALREAISKARAERWPVAEG